MSALLSTLRMMMIVAISWLIGLLLLSASILKVLGIAQNGPSESLLSPTMQLLSTQVEFLLGIWIITGWKRSLAWLWCIYLFIILAMASLYMASMGQRSCGCLGIVQINPWIMFVIDIVILALLLSYYRGSEQTITWKQNIGIAGLATIVTLATLTWGTTFLDRILVTARGEMYAIDPSVIDVGPGKTGEIKSFSLRVVNHSAQPVKLIGGTTDCGCFTVNDDLPITIDAGASVYVTGRLKYMPTSGEISYRFRFFTDCDQQKAVVGSIIASVAN